MNKREMAQRLAESEERNFHLNQSYKSCLEDLKFWQQAFLDLSNAINSPTKDL